MTGIEITFFLVGSIASKALLTAPRVELGWSRQKSMPNKLLQQAASQFEQWLAEK
jgi:hypothetical protein